MSIAELRTVSTFAEAGPNEETQSVQPDTWVEPVPETIHSNTAPEDPEMAFATNFAISQAMSKPMRRLRPPASSLDSRITVLQQWEGIISGVRGECVECELHDLTNPTYPIEQAEIYIEQFSPFDRQLLQEGTVFYWSVGTEVARGGQITSYSNLRVRRMPRLSKVQQREILHKASKFSESLNFRSS